MSGVADLQIGCPGDKHGEKKVGVSIISGKNFEYMLIPLQPFIGKPLGRCRITTVLHDARQLQAFFLQLADLYVLDDGFRRQHQ